MTVKVTVWECGQLTPTIAIRIIREKYNIILNLYSLSPRTPLFVFYDIWDLGAVGNYKYGKTRERRSCNLERS
jgi:hypothetical protein